MNILLEVLFTLLLVLSSEVHGASTRDGGLSDALITEQEARMFLVKSHQKQKRANIGEFELFKSANLERECIEEICGYEEVHEFFKDDEKTRKYWATLQDKMVGRGNKIPMVIGITFLVLCLLVFISIGLYYYCKQKRKYFNRNREEHVPMRRQDPQSRVAQPEDTSDAPGSMRGLPSYEDVMIASDGPHDLRPPAYPGSPSHPGQPDATTNEHPTQL